MGTIEKGSIVWPPRGWRQLGCINQSSGQALAKDIRTAKIFGLAFQIESEPLYQFESRFYRHKIFIDGWQYSILNESSEYPVLSFTLTDRYDIRQPRDAFVSDIRVMAKPFENRPVIVQRAVMAAQLLIKQIQLGQVPDHERILSVYHLHPKRGGQNNNGLGPDPITLRQRYNRRDDEDESDNAVSSLHPPQH